MSDGSSNGRTAYVLNGKGYVVQTASSLAQRVELLAVGMVFNLLVNNSLNLYTDGDYIFKAFQVIETIPCIWD